VQGDKKRLGETARRVRNNKWKAKARAEAVSGLGGVLKILGSEINQGKILEIAQVQRQNSIVKK
jgi:hypothetical protein